MVYFCKMKKLILGALLLLSTNIYGQTSTVLAAIDSAKQAVKDGVNSVDTSGNFKMIYTDIKTGISALASGLKVGAEHVYEVLVRQQLVNAIVWLIVFVASVIFLRATIKYAIKVMEKEGMASEAEAAMVFFGNLLSVLMFIVALFHIDTIVTGFVNPEYGAIETIIDIVKQSK